MEKLSDILWRLKQLYEARRSLVEVRESIRMFGLIQEIKDFKDRLVCVVKNHDWVDDSYGGPDSGADGGHCARCGYSFYVRMY